MKIYEAREFGARDLVVCAGDAQKQIDDLKMVCRRLSAAKTLVSRDKIAKQCHGLFAGNILRSRR